ncbi:Phenylacetaldehyde dehydrogenase [Cedecea neteri]|uniref:Phenylacetaldehyde dehydrogenase n=1 Tax=Cedecea neteri TaxID=158822 RepID=A0A2X3J1W6_9ENTR|nr:Phenylacetaldehyde dehydrogenase [Cedecea neteri]
MTEPETVSVLGNVRQFLQRSHGLYIDGGWQASDSEERLPVFNPADGQQISSSADASAADVDRAVTSAWRAFSSGVWANMLPAGAKESCCVSRICLRKIRKNWRSLRHLNRANLSTFPARLRLAAR